MSKPKTFKQLGLETYPSLAIPIPSQYCTIEVRAIVVLKNQKGATKPESVFWIIECGANILCSHPSGNISWEYGRNVPVNSRFETFEEAVAFVKTNWDAIAK